jgi:outer membrane immunogenic protein
MMRSFAFPFVAALVTLAPAAKAAGGGQAPLSTGQLAFNGGVGLGRAPLPLYVGLDGAVHPDVTVGGDLFVSSRLNGVTLMGRVDYHWNRLLGIPRDGDLYLGAGLVVADYGLWPRLQVGGRWFFSERVGLNLELGGESKWAGGLFGVTVKTN